jgi:hypothetical protein
MILEGTFDGKLVRITYNGEGKPCRLNIHFLAPINMDVDRGEFQNPKGLSAQLRSEIGYKECCEILFAHDIPKDSGLWALNHDGYPSEHFIQQFFPGRT